MRYLPHTPSEIEEMLARIGAPSIDALFHPVPEAQRCEGLKLPDGLDEPTLMRELTELSQKNSSANALSFLGGGMYDHHIPPAVDQLLNRSEFYTAYTPYQAEVSQGTLQSIFEFQTMVCQILGMEVANASMYDGASGTAEAVLMARRIFRGKRKHIVMSAGVHPHYQETVRTYLAGQDGEPGQKGEPKMTVAPLDASGRTDLDAVRATISDETAAVVIGYPNFFGCVEDLRTLRAICDEHKALLITATNEPYALSLVAPPGEFGVDIAVGEGQAMAVPPQFGGPGVGLFATRKKYVRQMPGRLAGETVDEDGARGFVLTLSTREQHIRRERATSNICTNHGLIALAMTIRTAMLGRSGFLHAGKSCLRSAEYLKAQIGALAGFAIPCTAPTFNEFVVQRSSGKAAPLLAALRAKGILAGIDLGRFSDANADKFLVAVTEKHTREDLDRLVAALASV